MKKRAIILFSFNGREEVRRKSLGCEQKSESLFFDHCNWRIKRFSQNLGIDFFHFDENKQVGEGFGERFCHAIKSVFDLSYNQLILLGNDALELRECDIKRAFEKLDSHDYVLGPNFRGGIYLLGLNEAAFSVDYLKSAPWCSAVLFDYLKDSSFSISTLRSLHDLNEARDVLTFTNLLDRTSVLYKWLCKFRAPARVRLYQSMRMEEFQSMRENEQRGPPIGIRLY